MDAVHLRDVRLDDVDAYVRMRCDPAMTAHLGGPRDPAQMPDKVARDVADVEADLAWICMILAPGDPHTVAGTVTVFTQDERDPPVSEIGWMVLPRFQGSGLAAGGVRALLARERDERRWGDLHAFPDVDNTASNRICARTGFTLLGDRHIEYAGHHMHVNEWRVDPHAG